MSDPVTPDGFARQDTSQPSTGSEDSQAKANESNADVERGEGMRSFWKLKMRGVTDDLPQSWWFASTVIPLLAATIGPLANVLSIAALVTKWRVKLLDDGRLPLGADNNGIDMPDPRWEVTFNAISLTLGFAGNFFLLCNFTRIIRYIICLPVTIISWFLATGILTGIIVGMAVYDAPIPPGETYSQGFWHAVIASVLYMFGSCILMINMLGYFLGHYPQNFELDDDQRTLILQTMMFFFWLAAGAAVFARMDGWSYANGLYFCDVSILTVGFGDFVPETNPARGVLIIYSIFGIIFLGLMISSIRKFALSMSRDRIIKAHEMKERTLTYGRTVTSEKELRDRLGLPPRRPSASRRRSSGTEEPSDAQKSAAPGLVRTSSSLDGYGHLKINGNTITFQERRKPAAPGGGRGGAARTMVSDPVGEKPSVSNSDKGTHEESDKSHTHHHRRFRRKDRHQTLVLLKEEKDRFDAMRNIQQHTRRFKQYYALFSSMFAFCVLWLVGAAIFMVAEQREQDLTYFESLYFCWVSLLTIGYGDLSPRSNAGKPFFVVWSLLAVPTMTILVSDMGETVIAAINRGTFTIADWTIMPKAGVVRDFIESHPKLKAYLQRRAEAKAEEKRLQEGFTVQDPDEPETAEDDKGGAKGLRSPSLEDIAKEKMTKQDFVRKLAVAIKRTAQDLREHPPVRYTYEDWVEFTRLIRFSHETKEELEEEEEEEGLVEWDWIGEDSPMLADVSESEWILDRLIESLNRFTRKQARKLTVDFDNSFDPNHPDHPGHPRISRSPGSPTHRLSYEDESPDPLERDEEDGEGSRPCTADNTHLGAHETAMWDAHVQRREYWRTHSKSREERTKKGKEVERIEGENLEQAEREA